MSSPRTLSIHGARENNLKEVSLDVPHDQLVVVTGLSGSGKSSLAFDTIYAEGQRRYIETFSPYTRQFFDKVKKPDVDLIEHVRPSVAIQQRTRITTSRSTVGSMTDLNDFLKILFANLAVPNCPACGTTLPRFDPLQGARHLIATANLRGPFSAMIGAEIKVGDKRAWEQEIDRLIALGFSRSISPTGSIRPLAALKEGEPEGVIPLVLDRIAVAPSQERRLREALEQAYTMGSGVAFVVPLWQSPPAPRSLCQVLHDGTNLPPRPFERWNLSSEPRCERGTISLPPPRPGLFSFNHPSGACPTCKGFGAVLAIDPNKVIPDPSKTIAEGAIACWAGASMSSERRRLQAFCSARKISLRTPWRDLPEADRELLFTARSREYRGILPWFSWLERKIYKMHVRVFFSRFRSQFTCSTCHGNRLIPEAVAYTIDGYSLPDLWRLPVSELLLWTEQLLKHRPQLARDIKDVIRATAARLRFLVDLGLPYLTLDRQSRTLSGGETQRVTLAAALGSELTSTTFVLDEPSIGLHPRDTDRLLAAVRALADRGNSVVMVEHDLDSIDAADHIIEIGPGAGSSGGTVVANVSAENWAGRSALHAPLPLERPPYRPATKHELVITNARARNLKGFSVALPLGQLVCLTGVSGSGKTTLAHEVILAAAKARQADRALLPSGTEVRGFEHLDLVEMIDQSPLAKSPRANIATYTGAWELVRKMLAATESARDGGLTASHFSFNVDGGRCPACKGAGAIREDMQFLSDVALPCEQCFGKRFLPHVLAVTERGKNVDDILAMTIDEAATFFAETPERRSREQLNTIAATLQKLGLGHLRLGHSLSELSGGEAQRLKLVEFITGLSHRRTLLIFDEPTTGLHERDVDRLIELLRALRAEGHSILCIEHNLRVIASADWMIDLGPEGGAQGGQLLVAGNPRELMERSSEDRLSWTVEHLRRWANGGRRARRSKKRTAPPVTALTVRGAREHNLKNIDVSLPLGKVVAFTGISGSGKSTIARDIIFAEGQRRFLDCLSPYARQFINELRKPDFDAIENVQPTICVAQHTFQPGALSTVGTMSEAYNFLRLLFAKIGVQHCPLHPEQPIAALSPDAMVATIQARSRGPIRLLAPVVINRKGTHREILERAIAQEISEVRVDGVFGTPGKFLNELKKTQQHTIEYVVARCHPANVERELLTQVVSYSLGTARGSLTVVDGHESYTLSTERACSICGTGFLKPDPEDLSFTSRRGRCERCDGRGEVRGVACPSCHGSRLQPRGRGIRLGGKTIAECSRLTPRALRDHLGALTLNPHERTIAEPILRELLARLETIERMGLGYLSLDRSCDTLSGGELQRLRLSAAMGSPLSGVLYVFDEPSAGLHPADIEGVNSHLRELTARGNSVVVIEHDPRTVLTADHIIEIGPGAGRSGGTITFEGSSTAALAYPSPALAALTAPVTIEETRPPKSGVLKLRQGHCHNVQGLDLDLPLGGIVAVAGVSGSGKSSLVHGVLHTLLATEPSGAKRWKVDGMSLTSSETVERVVLVDQQPIGATSRSTPASYLGVFDEIRKLFASSIDAKARGYTNSFFSYNTGKGRCPTCKGLGVINLEMSFLADAQAGCESCQGRRYREEALAVRYLGITIAEALQLTFEEAKSLFARHDRVHRPLHHACALGLGYLTLGQSSKTLSGGESQRIKLAAELSGTPRGHTLYLLDEPTTGLHRLDVRRLIGTLRELVDRGGTAFVIEHDADLIAAADWVVEMGPGPGSLGGKVLFSGAVSELAQRGNTPWGEILRGHDGGEVANLGNLR